MVGLPPLAAGDETVWASLRLQVSLVAVEAGNSAPSWLDLVRPNQGPSVAEDSYMGKVAMSRAAGGCNMTAEEENVPGYEE